MGLVPKLIWMTMFEVDSDGAEGNSARRPPVIDQRVVRNEVLAALLDSELVLVEFGSVLLPTIRVADKSQASVLANPTEPIRIRDILALLQPASLSHKVGQGVPSRVVQVQDVAIDLDARTVHVGAAHLSLTAIEFDILAILARSFGRAVSRRDIVEEIWGGFNQRLSRNLDVHLANLRGKLARPDILQTVRGFGYRLGGRQGT